MLNYILWIVLQPVATILIWELTKKLTATKQPKPLKFSYLCFECKERGDNVFIESNDADMIDRFEMIHLRHTHGWVPYGNGVRPPE